MPRFYIEAFDANRRQILGNLDGQAVMACKDYKRTCAYKKLFKNTPRQLSLGGRAKFYDVVNEAGIILETIDPSGTQA